MTPEELKKYDFIVLVDKSDSMNEKDCKGQTRWVFAQESVLGLARECMKYDDNGITVGFFASKLSKLYENVTDGVEVLKTIFAEQQPAGSTDTAGAVKQVIDQYLAVRNNKDAKPIIVVVVTDGRPTDEPALVKVIVDATKVISSREEIGLQFIQVGFDPHAKDFLKRLDNDLTKEGAKFDIVSTTNCDDLGDRPMSEVLIAALTE